MPATRSSTRKGTKITPEEAADLTRRIPRWTAPASMTSSESETAPEPGRRQPVRGRARNLPVLPSVPETEPLITPPTRSASDSEPGDPPAGPNGNGQPFSSYATSTPSHSESERTDRRTPPARNSLLETLQLPGPIRHLSTVLPSDCSVVAQFVSVGKPLNWTGRVEGESYVVRPRE
ncbi:hypothetical protein B0H19DRAFT_1129804 [Mycena capillaripes]|nr:hypothetical protein B0H19DRAFT_1129804 [Mycena capillaripes]